MPNIEFSREEYNVWEGRWTMIRDCLSGAEAVKCGNYLPALFYSDDPKETQERNERYQERAFFVNFVGRTCDGLIGQVFAVDPVVDIPAVMDILKTDADGAGVSLDQSSKKSCGETLAYGRSGLLLDFPDMGTPATREQINNGEVRPVLCQYSPWSIRNWRTATYNSVTKLTLVVLDEDGVAEDDGFEIVTEPRWRECRLVKLTEDPDEVPLLEVRVWRKVQTAGVDGWSYEVEDEFFPVDAKSNRLTYIPFQFIGSLNNDSNPDKPPLYDLAECNIAHFRNSADYEDCIHMLGQPTPWFAGLTEEWAEKHGPIRLGAFGAIPLPVDGSAGLLQAEPNTMVKEAMDHKERVMVSLGAKLVEQRDVQRTLGEAKMERATETSVLASVAHNVSAAYTQVLRWAAVTFYGLDPTSADAIWYTLSTDFAVSQMTPEELTATIAAWQAGTIAFVELRDRLREVGLATLDDDEAKEMIDAENPPVALDAKGNPIDPNNPGPVNDPENPNPGPDEIDQ